MRIRYSDGNQCEMAAADDNSIGDDDVAAALVRDGWCCVDAFLDQPLARALAQECRTSPLVPAAVGRTRVHDAAVRGDATRWLEPGTSAAQDALLARFEALRVALNR